MLFASGLIKKWIFGDLVSLAAVILVMIPRRHTGGPQLQALVLSVGSQAQVKRAHQLYPRTRKG
ncbi:hypothetical protein Hdeb2414_s0008g00284421 [Helianthus debilis subsp. tardiflorus]